MSYLTAQVKKIIDNQNKQEDNVIRLIAMLVRSRFYGELIIKFEDGHATVGKKTETIKF